MNNNFLTLIAALALPLLLVAARAEMGEQGAAEGPNWVELEGDELESELSICPSDAEETGKLEGRLVLFSDFCLQARDHVMGDVKRSVHQLVGSVSSLFLGSFDRLGIDADRVRAAAEQHGGSGRLGGAGHEASRREAAEETRAGGGGGGGGLPNPFGPIMWAIAAVGSTVARQVSGRLDQLARAFGLDRLQAAVGGACDRVGQYERHLRSGFKRVRDELAEELGLDERDELRRLELEQVPCTTAGRVLRLQSVCRFGAQLQQHPLLSVLLKGQWASERRNLVE